MARNGIIHLNRRAATKVKQIVYLTAKSQDLLITPLEETEQDYLLLRLKQVYIELL